MPPAFLFPESDPPPSDLIPDQNLNQVQTSSGGESINETRQQPQQHQKVMNGEDSTDASPLLAVKNNNKHFQPAIEEYTLPDLFPNPPPLHHQHQQLHFPNNNKGESTTNNNNQQHQHEMVDFHGQQIAFIKSCKVLDCLNEGANLLIDCV
jgi:hypothetical protein